MRNFVVGYGCVHIVRGLQMSTNPETPHGPLAGIILENAQGPARVKGDSSEVQQHSLRDQIAADKYLASKEATRRGLGAIFKKLVPPGAD